MAHETLLSQSELRQAVSRLDGQIGPAVTAEILQVLSANLAGGRIAFYLANRPSGSPDDYVRRVCECYLRLHPYLRQLQVEKSAPAWDALLAKMQRWGYSFLLKKGFDRSEATYRLAYDYSADAAAALVHARFPYDTEFDPWAVVLLQNTCRKRMRAAVRQNGGAPAEVSAGDAWMESFPDPRADDYIRSFDLRQEIRQAFETLSVDERQVLRLYYFDELKPADIAARLGRPSSYVYAIKFRALARLKEVLAQNGYSY